MLHSATHMAANDEERMIARLGDLGVTGMWRMHQAARIITRDLNGNEQLIAAIGGFHGKARTILVATNHRLIMVGHRPMITDSEEFSYAIITGVRLVTYGLFSSVTLHTHIGDIEINKVNNTAAITFAGVIEQTLAAELPTRKVKL
ncbi:PH domain-containing protein [Candidatus Saccharibacteria bacterium]|nr:PH domain-containing protein [Candidatus Saccharibacteria bacterium]